jgi:hypothetical protein
MNTTSKWLNANYNNITSQLTKFISFKFPHIKNSFQTEDYLHDFYARIMEVDLLDREFISDEKRLSHLKTCLYRFMLNSFRSKGKDYLEKSFYGHKTQTDVQNEFSVDPKFDNECYIQLDSIGDFSNYIKDNYNEKKCDALISIMACKYIGYTINEISELTKCSKTSVLRYLNNDITNLYLNYSALQ